MKGYVENIQCPPKVLGQFVKLTKSRYHQNSSHLMQNNQFSPKIDAGYQTIWIEDQAPCFVGPDLDPYCLQRSFKIKICLENLWKYFNCVPELLEDTVCFLLSAHRQNSRHGHKPWPLANLLGKRSCTCILFRTHVYLNNMYCFLYRTY